MLVDGAPVVPAGSPLDVLDVLDVLATVVLPSTAVVGTVLADEGCGAGGSSPGSLGPPLPGGSARASSPL